MGTKFNLELDVDEKTFWFVTLRVNKIKRQKTFIFSTSKDDCRDFFSSQTKPECNFDGVSVLFRNKRKKRMIVDTQVLEEQVLEEQN